MDLLKKKWFWGAVVGLAVIALVIANMIGLNRAAKVKVAAVEMGKIVEQIYTNGKLEPGQTTSVYAPASGLIEEVKVKSGDTVKKGQVLLTLSMEQVREQLEKERINLQLTEAERLAAKKQHFESFKQARLENPDLEPEELDLTTYDLRIRSSELTIQSLEKQLANQKVLAPADGVVTSLTVNAGQMLAEGSEIATIADVSKLKVSAYLNELDAGKAEQGMKAVVTGEAFSNSYEGSISYLAPTAGLADPTSKDTSVEMEVSLNQVSSELRPGYNVTVEMEIPDKERLLVPIDAVQYDGEQAYVFKVQDGVAVKVPVTTGKEGEAQIELVSGVAAGDLVVVEGGDKLQDGAKVKVK
ncbi:RND family efflux transporter, MFP subunit [Paenibacillus barengoltzii]|jgi:RND family efflux transporter MFP subunit|uniref:efflux RND transporter periplasmic adaptor subunit n=1 Tax=Paenibacillus barengoltzii TaxID=343517 RepID=UPI000A08BF4B|nr:efflux RND transporter periplasmic adaptor subunit [Paenibacillus barengoltzii]SMF48601.1 RND family efflux transporter, MFP subunit [Paenibacillus barengoltzii]